MNKKLKSQIKSAFNVSESIGKDEFLKSITYPKSRPSDFVLEQIGYIRKRVWMISLLILIATLYGLHLYGDERALEIVWGISSVLPFVSLIMIAEVTRSMVCNMVELEMSCKHSLFEVILVRLSILGSFNFIVFVLTLILFMGKTDFSLVRLGIYVLTPFLLTCLGSLFVINKIHSREITYICGGISGFVSLINTILTTQYSIIFENQYRLFWGILFFSLVFLVGGEIVKLLKKMEEFQWHSQLNV